MPLTNGMRLGRYEITAPLGKGGMGVVYRARDHRLGREVAIKVLPDNLADHPEALARLEREARAVASLSHPNIVAVFDVGNQDGVSYLVSELLEGETLRARLAHGPLPWRLAAEIAESLAEGLAAAHARGIVHRDLKPANIFLTPDGRVRILDFGLALVSRNKQETVTDLTQAGAIVGTVGYMSPEQVRSETLGPASDIFSLGCVIYEMICGQKAFHGNTAVEIASSILHDNPASPMSLGIQAPAEFDRLIHRCLQKDPARRSDSAQDLARELKAVARGDRAPAASAKRVASIAVLPFENAARDSDSEYLCDGITESIINSLVQLQLLRVVPRSTVFRYKGQGVEVQALGRQMNADVVLTGRIVHRGDSLVIAAELIDVAEGSQLWGERYNRRLADVFELEEEIARKVSESLRIKLSGDQKQRLAKRFTGNPEAYQLYWKGRHCWVQRIPESLRKSVAYFQEAIEKDPEYALAYAGLADCHSYMALYLLVPERWGWAKSKAAAASAIALDPDLAEGHTSLGFIRGYADRDLPAAEAALARALELNPDSWLAHFWSGNVLSIFSRYAAAEEHLRKALELEPLSPVVMQGAAFNSIGARRFDEAVDRCLTGLEIHPQYANLHLWLGLAYECQGRYADAIREFHAADEGLKQTPIILASQAHAYAMAGDCSRAEQIFRDLLASWSDRQPDTFIAIVQIALGERSQAIESLEKAWNNRSGTLNWLLKADPRFDPLRDDPRVQAMTRWMSGT